MVLAIVFAFVAGLITAVSPCVLPVLPIVFAGGAGESRRRPFAIIAGLAFTFLVSILFAALLLDALGLPKDLLRNLSIGMLFLLAATLIFPQVGVWIERPLTRLSRRPSGDLGGGFLLGCALGFVFVPCGGPAIGFVTISASAHEFGFKTFAVAVAYTLGVSAVLLAIAIGGRRAAGALRVGVQRFRVAFGVILAASGFALIFDLDTKLQTRLPNWTQFLQDNTEASASGRKAFERTKNVTERAPATAAAAGADGLPDYGPAPDFAGVDEWLNSAPLTMAQLRGKVVLIDFWTYSCINCLRTLPHLEAWDRMYRKAGLVIVGVHTPEFAFEHVPSNVRGATKRLGVRYPVALDNGYGTWNAYGNQYWPAEYLIDRSGHVRRAHFGEGEYGETEETIRSLLGEKPASPASDRLRDLTPSGTLTPESYLGWARIDRFAGSPIRRDKEATYAFPAALAPDELAYSGRWTVHAQQIVAGKDARLELHYNARKVYLVLGGHGTVRVLVDGKPRGAVKVTSDRLYTLVDGRSVDDAVLELRFSPGVSAYAFTFG
ncbi:MAG TPA: redoxin domain-containing protein [Gaiellaceae bacterium]|jgi:cytochrome c biogenesis protein CcdA/thiol-disulfide isomerase/thioredoxin